MHLSGIVNKPSLVTFSSPELLPLSGESLLSFPFLFPIQMPSNGFQKKIKTYLILNRINRQIFTLAGEDLLSFPFLFPIQIPSNEFEKRWLFFCTLLCRIISLAGPASVIPWGYIWSSYQNETQILYYFRFSYH